MDRSLSCQAGRLVIDLEAGNDAVATLPKSLARARIEDVCLARQEERPPRGIALWIGRQRHRELAMRGQNRTQDGLFGRRVLATIFASCGAWPPKRNLGKVNLFFAGKTLMNRRSHGQDFDSGPLLSEWRIVPEGDPANCSIHPMLGCRTGSRQGLFGRYRLAFRAPGCRRRCP